tara:strand:- start:238 stop:1059 length:822 start_codon:yes stop_codon:yes gene_type:complete
MAENTPIPKSQEQLSNESLGTTPIDTNNRAYQVSRDDNVDNFTVGIKDIDEAIFYYFNEVLKPSVTQNGKTFNVPVVYGSPERWAAMQKDGYYRDKNGKMQAPLIVFRRDSLERNRNLGNKLDGNKPVHFGVFQKKFSRKNSYDKFDVLNNREPVKEYYAVAIPDYVNIVYSCIIYTDYMEQNNKIIEGINFASDSYWGNPTKFRFRAMIDNYTTATEIVQGNDRIVKTNFSINLLGHIVTDTINAQAHNSKKYYSKAAVKVTTETTGNINDI